MSEYVSKKALLEFIKARKAKFAGSYKDIEYGAYLELETIEMHIESGAFDADESEGTWKATAEILGRENAQMNSEVQRLRAALERIRKITKESREAKYHVDQHLLIEKVAEQALSTTTDTGAERAKAKIADRYKNALHGWHNPVDRAAESYYNGYLNGVSDTLRLLDITIPGINAPKGEGNDA